MNVVASLIKWLHNLIGREDIKNFLQNYYKEPHGIIYGVFYLWYLQKNSVLYIYCYKF